MNLQEELNEFIRKMEEFSHNNCPSWLTPNSNYFGVEPGHNLDLLKIAFDYRIDRTFLLSKAGRDFLQDPEKPQLGIVK